MVEKIARIARIKSVDYDVGKSFDSGHGRGEDGKSFAAELSRVMNKKTEKTTSTIPEAYKLELSNYDSEALFYFGATDLRTLLN